MNPVRLTTPFAVVMAVATLMVTTLHAIEGIVWATAYLGLGALPDLRSAVLYSLSAITSYGHANVFLDPHWEMMGALEALNGMILFGLTTAFLFAMIQQVLPIGSRGGGVIIKGSRRSIAQHGEQQCASYPSSHTHFLRASSR